MKSGAQHSDEDNDDGNSDNSNDDQNGNKRTATCRNGRTALVKIKLK